MPLTTMAGILTLDWYQCGRWQSSIHHITRRKTTTLTAAISINIIVIISSRFDILVVCLVFQTDIHLHM